MRRIGIIAGLIVFVVMGTCLADEIRGNVSSVDKSNMTLQISGVTIETKNTWIENEQDYPLALNDIAKGDYIEVSGKFSGLSKINARKIDRKNLECGVVKGRIASIDSKKREIIISGITVKVPGDAWLEGPNRVRIPLELFAVGYSVECRGNWTGNSELTAFKIAVE